MSVLRKVNEMRERKSSNTISGPEYFGLTNPFVKEMIEELPNAEKCTKYKKKKMALQNKLFCASQ